MRMIFMGTPTFSVPALKVLSSSYDIVAVYTQPPKNSGRGKKERKTQIHEFAQALGLPVLTPLSFQSREVIDQFRSLKPDIVVVAAYGLLLPDAVIRFPNLGCFNIHASLLPRWRGAAPIERAIIAGDKETGVTIMRMDAGLDTGSMLSKVTVTINDTTTAGDLHQVISELGAELIFSAMKLIIKGQAIETPQSSSGITYAKKIQKPELQLEFTMHARDVLRRIHGFSPTPGAFIYFQGTRIKILAAELIDAPISKNVVPGTVLDEHFTVACKQGAVRFLKVQRNGKKIMDVKSFLCGVSVPTGTLFT